MGASGTATVDFGAFVAATSIAGHPSTHAQVAVTGQAGIVVGSLVEAWIRAEPAGTAQHSMEEHIIEALIITAGNIAAGTGFTIYAEVPFGGTWGTFTLGWCWN
jgi:hypothetical protein